MLQFHLYEILKQAKLEQYIRSTKVINDKIKEIILMDFRKVISLGRRKAIHSRV